MQKNHDYRYRSSTTEQIQTFYAHAHAHAHAHARASEDTTGVLGYRMRLGIHHFLTLKPPVEPRLRKVAHTLWVGGKTFGRRVDGC
jgi:hypothetical protein